MRLLILTLIVFWMLDALAQTGAVFGTVTTRQDSVLVNVNIAVNGNNYGVTTDASGKYELQLTPGQYEVTFSHIGFKSKTISLNVNQGAFIPLNVRLRADRTTLESIEVTGERNEDEEGLNQTVSVDAKSAQNLPSAFGDFSKIIVTLPGVYSNNEFSTGYSVRGGNFDENLVYVNDIPIYRPFLSNAGRQEGLSFVNPNLVSNIRFSAGGWEPKYGDKLSSSLNILYQEPDTLSGNVTLGLLGGAATFREKISDRVRVTTGIRHKDSRYLLSATEIEGQYFPTYTDVQSLFTFDLTNQASSQKNKTKLHWLLYYGRNRYLTEPESQTTEFGSIQANFRIETGFQGREILDYDVYQSGINLSHIWSDQWLTRVIASGVYTREREYFDVEGAYRICDVDTQTAGADPNDCVVVRGIGTHYDYGRNQLNATIGNLEVRNEHLVNLNNLFEWGVGYQHTAIDDEINEYAFTDSADFVQLNRSVFNDLSLNASNITAFVQHTRYFSDSVHAVIFGGRLNHYTYTRQTIFSPRVSYRLRPRWKRPTTFSLAVGWYQQFPFYRELRTNEGELRDDPKAQRSIHVIGGFDRSLTFWGRPFYLRGEVYFKQLSNVIPYNIDNVRLRYLEQNNAQAFAAGFDIRLNGEFIPGTQSWFSFGYLQSREEIEGDGNGYIRRPLDQRINAAMYFEDHMPHDPTLRIYVNMVFGSGYPTGPPENLSLRNAFAGDEYYRADVGLSKYFFLSNKAIKSFVVRLEVLNALGADNTLSYNWIEDIGGNQFAVPNSLSARFLNIKISAEF